MKSGDKFRSRSALFEVAVSFFVPTQMHGKNSPLEDMLLLMDTMHREPHEKAAEEEKKTRKRNVSQA
jgi:hypothetical protein